MYKDNAAIKTYIAISTMPLNQFERPSMSNTKTTSTLNVKTATFKTPKSTSKNFPKGLRNQHRGRDHEHRYLCGGADRDPYRQARPIAHAEPQCRRMLACVAGQGQQDDANEAHGYAGAPSHTPDGVDASTRNSEFRATTSVLKAIKPN